MNEDFQRYAKLTAYDAVGTIVYDTVTGQRIRFEVGKSVKPTPNHCSVRVYGLDQEDADAVLVRGQRIELSAGDSEKNAGVIFRGRLVDGLYANGSPPYLQVEALDGDAFYQSYISLGVGAGETLYGLVSRSAAACSAPIALGMISSSLSAVRLPRGCALFGATIDTMDNVARAVNAAWFINDERLYILIESDMLNGSVYTIDADEDLVGIPIVDAWSAAFSCHINSRVILGSTVNFDDNEVAIGVFRVVSVAILGDTLEGDWKMNVSALRQDGVSPAMTAMTRNIWR